MEPQTQERILQEVEDRAEVERLLRYDEETAGGRMTTHLVTVRDTATAAEALDEIRRQSEEVEEFYQVFVVDGDRRLVGILPFKSLVVSRPERPIREFMADADISVKPDLDQEEVARLMARYNLPSVAVVDDSGRLLGRVTFDDVIDVVEAETTEDLLKFGGVSPDEELGGGWTDVGAEPAPVALRQPADRVPRRRAWSTSSGTRCSAPWRWRCGCRSSPAWAGTPAPRRWR